jgi:hypothetical protein
MAVERYDSVTGITNGSRVYIVYGGFLFLYDLTFRKQQGLSALLDYLRMIGEYKHLGAFVQYRNNRYLSLKFIIT